MTDAFLMKLVFTMVARSNDLWVRFIRTKYKWLTDDMEFPHSPCASRLWKAMGSDRIGWVLTPKRMFTVKSAYEFRADCAEAIKLIHQDDRLGGPLIIVHHIREFLKKNWCISYVCINRVNNRVADALATTVNTSDFSLVEFDDPPNFVLPLLQEDMSSFSAPT
ncbi:hypothetical protein V6N13_089835 [Hibiscus sabdariffa]